MGTSYVISSETLKNKRKGKNRNPKPLKISAKEKTETLKNKWKKKKGTINTGWYYQPVQKVLPLAPVGITNRYKRSFACACSAVPTWRPLAPVS